MRGPLTGTWALAGTFAPEESNMKRIIGSILLLLSVAACQSMQVVERDPGTGYFPTSRSATVVKNASIDLDQRRELLVIGRSDFLEGQLGNIGFFNEVLTVPELETRIVREGLTDKVPSVRDKIGLSNAARHYQPFLWLRVDRRSEGNRNYAQFILTDGETLEDYFITETYLDTVWAGVTDRNNWYPMFNSLIDFLDDNSATWSK
jgi:hypothetical protein